MKHHIFRSSDVSICEKIYSVFGIKRCVRCAYVSKSKNGGYKCSAFGFRSKISGTRGVCTSSGRYNLYDSDLLRNTKNNKYNFCCYRVIAPVLTVISVAGAGAIINLVFKIV